jgi:PIN domain nuclease of toxin-antitoxin system
MRILLDTHTFIWFIEGNEQLSDAARQLIEEPSNQIFLSVASQWEMIIKISLGKLKLASPFETLIPKMMRDNDISLLNIAFEQLVALSQLPLYHRDPFDRLLIAQAITEQCVLISKDAIFTAYPVKLFW